MRKIFIIFFGLLLTSSLSAQNPFDVNTNVNITHTVGGDINSVPTTNGMVFKGSTSSDPLFYKIVDDAKLLAEVTDGVRSANLSGKVTVPATVQMQGKTYKVVNIGENAFKGCVKITSVEIMGNNLQKLAHNCFAGCTRLTSIRLNSNCLNLKSDAFVGCTHLETVTVSQKANNFTFEQCAAKVVKY